MWGTSGGGLARLCGAAFAGYCSYALCRTPLLPLFALELGGGPLMVGLVVAASTLTGVVVKLPAGALSDVLGRKSLLLAGALVFALMPFAHLAVSTLAGLVVLRIVHGNATAVFGPVAAAAVSDLAPPDRRGTWLGMYATAQGAGQAFGPVLAGSLLATGRFDLAFVAAGAIGLAAPVIVAGWTDTPIPSAAHAAQFVLNGALNAFLPLHPLHARDVIGLTTPV